MHSFPIRTLTEEEYPPLLHEIPDKPKQLNARGMLPPRDTSCLAVVGSRQYTTYGKQVVEYLITGLRGYPVSIISGLARGIDALAHETALNTGLYTLAVPGSGLDDSILYPRQNKRLAHRILESGGGLLSEFDPLFTATLWSFPQRNRIMAGLSHATLVIEAGEKSGTLITARLTADYNRELLVVPGNIFSEHSKGPHQFLKIGATPVTTPEDIVLVLGLAPRESDVHDTSSSLSLADIEKEILSLLSEPRDRDTLIRMLSRPAHEVSVLLMQLELRNFIREEGGFFHRLW